MKKIISLLFVTLFITNLNGQVNYIPFPSDSAVWTGQFQTHTKSSHYYSTLWLGDTTINGINYTKCYKGNIPMHISFTYSGGVRQDIANKKLYYIDLNGIEHDISVDFNLQVNDKFLFGQYFENIFPFTYSFNIDTLVVESIDTSNNEKAYNLNWSNLPMSFQAGRFEFGKGFIYLYGFEWACTLDCIRVNNYSLYGNPFYCNIIYSVYENQKNNELFSLSPNPVKNELYINTENYSDKILLTIIDAKGQIVKTQQITDTQTKLDISSLMSGIYFFRIITDKIVEVKKIIKE